MLPRHTIAQLGHNLEFIGVFDAVASITSFDFHIDLALAKRPRIENQFVGFDFKL